MNGDPCEEFSDALGVLESHVTKPELIQALWYVLRIHDQDDDRPMAFTLTLLVRTVNLIRDLNGGPGPIVVPVHSCALRDNRKQGAERLALACAAALELRAPTVPGGTP
jgi:hypothetical protein